MHTCAHTHTNGCVCKAAKELFHSRSCLLPSGAAGSCGLHRRGQHLVLPGMDTARWTNPARCRSRCLCCPAGMPAPRRTVRCPRCPCSKPPVAVGRNRGVAEGFPITLVTPEAHSCAPPLRTLVTLRATGPCSPTAPAMRPSDGPPSFCMETGSQQNGRRGRQDARLSTSPELGTGASSCSPASRS